jgi:hypothetical protein
MIFKIVAALLLEEKMTLVYVDPGSHVYHSICRSVKDLNGSLRTFTSF